MDIFIEKLVKKQKTPADTLKLVGIIILALIVAFAALTFVPSFGLFIAVAAFYGAYILITSLNVEFEYSVTNGELDIDRIVSQRKRKRIFSAKCKEFEVVAKLSDPSHKREVQNVNIKKRIEAVSSMNSPDVYFATLVYKGERTIVFFEPNDKMLSSFKALIPRKVFD